MKPQLKLFHGTGSHKAYTDVMEQFSAWSENHPDIGIVSTNLTSTENGGRHHVCYSILYFEAENDPDTSSTD